MTDPRLVVMVGAYNEEQYLEETIPSILAQSFDDFLLFLNDNGSTDRTGEMLRDFAASDPRCLFTESHTNLWPPVVTNRWLSRAMSMAPGTRWFLAHGADDLMLPGYLDAIMDVTERVPSANCIFSPWQWIGRPDKGVKIFPVFNPDTCHEQHQIPAWRAITRELWDAVGPEDETIRIGSDWEWPVRAATLGVLRPVQLDRPYISLRVRPPEGGRVSQSEEVNWRELYRKLCRVAGKPIAGWAC